jgi:hypothetical protein
MTGPSNPNLQPQDLDTIVKLMGRMGISIDSQQLRRRCFQVGNFIVIVFSLNECLYLKYEYSIHSATIFHHSTVDTVFRKILPVMENGVQWLYLFGENGMLVQMGLRNNQPPVVNTIQCNKFFLLKKLFCLC